MKIAITSNGANLDAPTSPVFGRCPMYVLVETETLQFEAIENPAIAAPSGAGIQAAQLVVERGAQAVVTGNVGPNALEVFQSAGVPIYLFKDGTVRDAVEAFKAGKLQPIAIPNAQAGAGTERDKGWEWGAAWDEEEEWGEVWGKEGGWGKAWEWAGAPPRLPRQARHGLRLSLPIPAKRKSPL